MTVWRRVIIGKLRAARAGGDHNDGTDLHALRLRPLSIEVRYRYVDDWQVIQGRFVDDPVGAVAGADWLIRSVMADRGYALQDLDECFEEPSIDRPDAIENYCEARRLLVASTNGGESTEALRQAMRHYRALFTELVDSGAAIR